MTLIKKIWKKLVHKIFLQQLTQAFKEIPFNKMLGLRLDEINSEIAILTFDMQDHLIGNFVHGILHGGVISSVIDMAGGMVAMGAGVHKNIDLPILQLKKMISRTSTIDLQISYLNPGRGTTFTATAFLIKSGNHITFTRTELKNQDDVLIATGTATYLLK